MARNGKGTAAAKTGMPFSELSEDNREWLKSFEDIGWRVNFEGEGYTASKTFDGDSEPTEIGPCDAFMVMMNLVEKAENERGDIPVAEIDLDSIPSSRLPGMEEPAIEELDRQADACIDALAKRKAATTASKDQDDIMRQLMHKHDRKRYSRHGWGMVIEDSEKLVIKKEEQAPPKNPKKPKVVKGGDLLK